MSTGTHERPGVFARFRKPAPAPFAPEAPASPVHMVADEGNVMPCCGLTPFEVPRTDRVTMRPELVTCRVLAEPEDHDDGLHGSLLPEAADGIDAMLRALNGDPLPLSGRTAPWAPWDRPDGDVPHSEPETPLHYEYQRWYGWGLTLPDNRAPMVRAYIPEPYTPDLCADLADLPLFRDALSQRTRCRAGECLCGHPVTGDTWGERMVRAGIHLFSSDTDRILTAAPHLTLAAAVALSDEGTEAA